MKKYLAFFLLLSVTALVYGRPQKLVIKTDKESVELRYWPLDGKPNCWPGIIRATWGAHPANCR